MSKSKACSRCKQILPYEAFNKKSATPTGLNSACRECANTMKRNMTLEQRQHKNAMKRKWDAANPDKVRAMNLNAYSQNPEMFINNAYRRYARLKNNDRKLISRKDLQKIYAKPCVYCSSNLHIEIDHVIPISRGGRHAIGNLVPACRSCNRNKSNSLIMEWRKKRETPQLPTHS